jgi:hypothetical protein
LEVGTVFVIDDAGRNLKRDSKFGEVLEIALASYLDDSCAGSVEVDDEPRGIFRKC